jgi:hypothetical protein
MSNCLAAVYRLGIVGLAVAVLGIRLEPAWAASTNWPFDGLWQWTFTMPDGSRIQPRVRLHYDGTNLTGTTRFRAGTEMPITNGSVQGNQVRFQVVRQRDSRTVTTTYTGQLQGGVIKGTIESDWTGTPQTYPWEARQAEPDATGTWEWLLPTPGGPTQMTLTLRQQGEKLTGKLQAQGRRSVDIRRGRARKGEISFAVERQRDTGTVVSVYRGQIEGDTLKGTIQTDYGTGTRTVPWEAVRISDAD